MKKKIFGLLLVVLSGIVGVFSGGLFLIETEEDLKAQGFGGLTKGQADTLYCKVTGGCGTASDTLTGTGSNTQCAFFTGSHTESGDPGCVYDSATDTLSLAGKIGLGTATPSAEVTVFSSDSSLPRISLTGAEFFQGNTSTEGLAMVLGVNRLQNRQIWFMETDRSAKNSSNPALRFYPTYIDSIATDGTTQLLLDIQGNPLRLNNGGNATSVGGTLSVTGAITENSIPLFGGHYESTGGNKIGINTSYFGTVGTTVQHFVNTVSGDDSACDGLAATTGTTKPCAWKSPQRALDDVPNGFTVNPIITLAAETITGTQSWVMHSIPAGNGAFVTIQGFSGTPQATFTTTGAGAFSTTVSGSGKTGGVTSNAQVTFTPTATTGSLPGTIADADFFFSTIAATGILTLRGVLASSGGNLTLNTRATTAITTASLYPWATICSGTVNITGPVTGRLPALAISGVKITGSFFPSNVTLAGIYATGAMSLNDSRLTSGNMLFSSGTIAANCTADANVGCVVTDSVISGQAFEARGTWGSFVGGIFKGTQNYGLSFGSTVSSSNVGGAVISGAMQACDFEGISTSAIRLMGPVALSTGNMSSAGAPPNCGAGIGISFDIAGSPLQLDYGATFVGCGTINGKYGSPSIVHQDSSVLVRGTWSATNVTNAVREWQIGPGISFFQASDLPIRDIVENATVALSGYNSTSTRTNVEGPIRFLGSVSYAAPTGACSVSSDAVTCSGLRGTFTDIADINASTTRTAITWTNTSMTTVSVPHVWMCSTPDTNAMILSVATAGSGTSQITSRNVGLSNQTATVTYCFSLEGTF